jgi:hypothetical protein
MPSPLTPTKNNPRKTQDRDVTKVTRLAVCQQSHLLM